MKLNASVTVAGILLDVQSDNLKDLIRQVSFLQTLPTHGPDGSPVRFDYVDRSGYEFFGLVTETGWKLDFGQRKEDGALWAKTTEGWYRYDPEQNRRIPYSAQVAA